MAVRNVFVPTKENFCNFAPEFGSRQKISAVEMTFASTAFHLGSRAWAPDQEFGWGSEQISDT
eukprot:1160420-Pelagomonas_calceolata.AAC.16